MDYFNNMLEVYKQWRIDGDSQMAMAQWSALDDEYPQEARKLVELPMCMLSDFGVLQSVHIYENNGAAAFFQCIANNGEVLENLVSRGAEGDVFQADACTRVLTKAAPMPKIIGK